MTDSNVLTIKEAGYLTDLVRGVEADAKLRYYPDGAKSADYPVIGELRAFTEEGGGFWPADKDIRDATVHVSGMFEHWYPVRELLAAMINAIDGSAGLDKPMAMIDYPAPSGPLAGAARAALPALVLLGEYIGNTFDGKTGIPAFDRCAIIRDLKTALGDER